MHERATLRALLMSSLQEEHPLSSLIFLRRLFWRNSGVDGRAFGDYIYIYKYMDFIIIFPSTLTLSYKWSHPHVLRNKVV
jgi:hypothetical protein